nr:unnamed protein product [Digitaria exilis]
MSPKALAASVPFPVHAMHRRAVRAHQSATQASTRMRRDEDAIGDGERTNDAPSGLVDAGRRDRQASRPGAAATCEERPRGRRRDGWGNWWGSNPSDPPLFL